jgi:hypothetical protein
VEAYDRDLPTHCIQEPAVIRRVRVGAHELVVDDIITRLDLAMSFALIVMPDPPSAPGNTVRMDSSPAILPRLEDPTLRIHEGDALAA